MQNIELQKLENNGEQGKTGAEQAIQVVRKVSNKFKLTDE